MPARRLHLVEAVVLLPPIADLDLVEGGVRKVRHFEDWYVSFGEERRAMSGTGTMPAVMGSSPLVAGRGSAGPSVRCH